MANRARWLPGFAAIAASGMSAVKGFKHELPAARERNATTHLIVLLRFWHAEAQTKSARLHRELRQPIHKGPALIARTTRAASPLS